MTATRSDVAFAVGNVSRFIEMGCSETYTLLFAQYKFAWYTRNKVDFCGYSDADSPGDYFDRMKGLWLSDYVHSQPRSHSIHRTA